jgi:hypothetical protein
MARPAGDVYQTNQLSMVACCQTLACFSTSILAINNIAAGIEKGLTTQKWYAGDGALRGKELTITVDAERVFQ